MVIDQDAIDALIQSQAPAGPTGSEAVPATPVVENRPIDLSGAPDEVKTLLRVRVPVIVQLARRKLPLGAVRGLSVGTIIEFDKCFEGPLDLLINNHHIGTGEAIKVGEHFGLRTHSIDSAVNRVRAMGK